MKKTALSAFFLALWCSTVCFAAQSSGEYRIKAAFIYNFLLFTEWPEEISDDSDTMITIGILGEDPFGDAFRPLERKTVYGKTLTIMRFEKDTPSELLRRCHLLFISPSLKSDMEEILASLKDYPVLTVSEEEVFFQSGGMINFTTKKDRVGFEINRAAAEHVGIKFRSRLLRVATLVVGD